MSKVKFIDLGNIKYKKAWEYQEKLFNNTIKLKSENRKKEQKIQTENYLIFCEHPHVYTLGKSGDSNNLLVDEKFLKSRNAEFVKTNRGGDITYHGPGQIVGYPILDLDNFFTDIHKYLRFLEEAVILTLDEYGVKGERSNGETGVWIEKGTENARKICAIGVKTSRWVTMHGFAFNINSDLSYFGNIIPCGIVDKKVTSLEKELGIKINIKTVKKQLKIHLSNVFEMDLVD